jgi:hypothetical protein
MAAIECKEGLCISRLVDFELLLELKIEQKKGTSLHTSCYKATSSLKQSVRGQYCLSVPVIYFNITPLFERDLTTSMYSYQYQYQYQYQYVFVFVFGEVSLEPVFFERGGLILYFKMN